MNNYPLSPDELFDAVVKSVTTLGYTVTNTDRPTLVAFKTKVSLRTWGMNMTATIVPERDGSALILGGAAKGAQLSSYGEGKKIAKKVIAELAAR